MLSSSLLQLSGLCSSVCVFHLVMDNLYLHNLYLSIQYCTYYAHGLYINHGGFQVDLKEDLRRWQPSPLSGIGFLCLCLTSAGQVWLDCLSEWAIPQRDIHYLCVLLSGHVPGWMCCWRTVVVPASCSFWSRFYNYSSNCFTRFIGSR